MNVADIIGQFKSGKASARSHMRNLIEIAAADGNLGSEEQRLLEHAAVRNNITAEQLKEIQDNPSLPRFVIPTSNRDKFYQLYDLVHMMSVDKNVHSEEMRLCEIFALKFGYRKEVVREMIEMITRHIEQWSGAKETMDAVLAKLKVYE
ncbi:hypothetical protein WBG78_24700 [Chryseolinea sp. T2]|uniref:hypothetical protein n=1 Tax=Chryseolinea sp. T2 TaxID=3129255 RepID=UPI003077A27C